MSSLTAEQVRELTERINERFAEFDIAMSRVFERVTPGVVRLVFDVVEEWQAQAAATKYLAYEAAIDEGKPAGSDDGGFAEFEAFWPAMPDLQGGFDALLASPRSKETEQGSEQTSKGADVFAEHPVAGLPEPEPPTMVSRMPVMVSPMKHEPTHVEMFANGHHADELELSTATVVTLGAAHTGGNGHHHAGPSPATSATLGPEHTVVTRRPRTLTEVDALDMEDSEEGRLSRPGARAKKELDEIRAKAAARAKLGEVTREQLIAELKRQAMAGVMPTQDQFDIAKPAVWPKAQMLTKRFDTTWTDLADEAGLKLVRR